MVGVGSSTNNNEVTSHCNGDLIGAADIIGNETVCLTAADGRTQLKITLSELRKYMHTFEIGSQKFLFKSNEFAQLEGDTPQY
jgi:hypothetical protein